MNVQLTKDEKQFTDNILKKLYLTLILLLILTTAHSIVKGQESRIKTGKRISCSMAGQGDPWEVLTEDLEKVLVAFHKGYTVSEISTAYEIEEYKLISQLEPLVKANILIKEKNVYFPNILVATEEETRKVYSRAKQSAGKISETVQSNWDKIKTAYEKLNSSKTYSLNEQGFMLVGSRILDIGVLRALANSEELLHPAPVRPTPSHPNSKYYLWIEENSPDRFGYGQKDIELKFDNWYGVNFGSDNESRHKLEKKAVKLIESGEYDSPEHFAQLIEVPFLNKEDSKLWEKLVAEISNICLEKLLKEKNDIKELYNSLKTSQYSQNTFDDFYCWYYHYLYPLAINDLIKNDYFKMPEDKHTSIVLYNEKGNGVHFE